MILIDQLVNAVRNVEEPELRVVRVDALVRDDRPEVVSSIAIALTHRCVGHDPAATRTALALVCVFARRALAKLSLQASDLECDWKLGRPLTLGERKNFARRPQRTMIERACAEAHPDVLTELLRNSRLTEADVVRMTALPQSRATVLLSVASHAHWVMRERVRNALSLNPHTPMELTLLMMGMLSRSALRDIAQDTRMHETVRTLVHSLLTYRVGTPDAQVPPSSQWGDDDHPPAFNKS